MHKIVKVKDFKKELEKYSDDDEIVFIGCASLWMGQFDTKAVIEINGKEIFKDKDVID